MNWSTLLVDELVRKKVCIFVVFFVLSFFVKSNDFKLGTPDKQPTFVADDDTFCIDKCIHQDKSAKLHIYTQASAIHSGGKLNRARMFSISFYFFLSRKEWCGCFGARYGIEGKHPI